MTTRYKTTPDPFGVLAKDLLKDCATAFVLGISANALVMRPDNTLLNALAAEVNHATHPGRSFLITRSFLISTGRSLTVLSLLRWLEHLDPASVIHFTDGEGRVGERVDTLTFA